MEVEDVPGSSQYTSNTAAVFDLDLSDENLLSLVKSPLQESKNYWDSFYDLKTKTDENMNYWLGRHWQAGVVYEYQEDNLYMDNRIFTNTESASEIINSRIAQPEVLPAQDSVSSIQLSSDLQDALYAHSSKFHTQDLFRINTRNLQIKRRAYIKLRFDPSVGPVGEIIPELCDPDDIIEDKDARLFDNPRFRAHKIRGKSVQDLCNQFPDAEQKIYRCFGFSRTNGKGDIIAQYTQLRQQKNIYEIWFTYYDDNAKRKREGVMWCDEALTCVFGKMRNPNWNYEDEGFEDERAANFLDFPPKPFIRWNHLNDGSSAIDLTSIVEQAIPLQKIVNKRGFQIGDNADQGGGGIVFDTAAISKEDMAKVIGDPAERLGVNAKGNIKNVITRIAPPPLADYVFEDKADARLSIDNLFGTHAITRGEESGNKTLGQDYLQQQQDMSRQGGMANANHRAATDYYRLLVQMMKVYYTEDHWFKITGEDGQFDFVVMRTDLIEDGIEVNVEAGSMLPMDKASQRQAAVDLATAGLMDPLSLYEIMGFPNAKKLTERLIKYNTDPQSFAGDIERDNFNREAFMDIAILNAGEMPKLRSDVTPEYLQFRNEYMLTGEYKELSDVVKQMHIEHLKEAELQAQEQLQLLMTQAPTPADMQAMNQQAVEQATIEQAVASAQPQTGLEDAAGQVAAGVEKNNALLEKEQAKQPVA